MKYLDEFDAEAFAETFEDSQPKWEQDSEIINAVLDYKISDVNFD